MVKRVFVTGGVVSGLGKGITAAALAVNTAYISELTAAGFIPVGLWREARGGERPGAAVEAALS